MPGPGAIVVGGLMFALGLRLLALFARTRRLPELWLGLFFVTTGAGGFLVVEAFEHPTDPSARMIGTISLPLVTIGTAAIYAFNYTVFRPRERWALVLACAGTLAIVWGSFLQLGGFSFRMDASAPRFEFLVPRLVCFGWATYEGFRLHFMLERRLAVGLSDPVVVNRFLLFGLWSLAMTLLPVTMLSSLLVRSDDWLALLGVLSRAIGACMIVIVFLTFFPPRAYLSWIRRRASAEEQP